MAVATSVVGTADFTKSFISEKARPKLRKPALIVGLPGIGLVGKLAADNMIRVLKGKKFATLYSPHFPNQVISLKQGKLRVFGMHFYAVKLGKRDVVILRGDLQPLTVEGQYEVTAKILDYCSRALGASEVIAMAGYAVNHQPPKPRVFAATTSKTFLKKFTAAGAKLPLAAVPIVGMAGMVPGLARLYGMKGVCLLVETPGHVIDANGAKTLSDLLARMFSAKVDTAPMAKRAKKAMARMQAFERQQRSQAPAGSAPAMPVMPKDVSYIR